MASLAHARLLLLLESSRRGLNQITMKVQVRGVELFQPCTHAAPTKIGQARPQPDHHREAQVRGVGLGHFCTARSTTKNCQALPQPDHRRGAGKGHQGLNQITIEAQVRGVGLGQFCPQPNHHRGAGKGHRGINQNTTVAQVRGVGDLDQFCTASANTYPNLLSIASTRSPLRRK